MPKRGAKLPWCLTTTWADIDIRPFTATFVAEQDVLRERNERLRVANRQSDGEGTFTITHRENPDYVAPEPERCVRCHLWGTEVLLSGMDGFMCADHAEEYWDEINQARL